MIFYNLDIAWRNVWHRPVGAIISVMVVALALALSIAVIALADAGQEGIIQASDPFGMLVVGPAGSGQQLVLSTLFLQGNPIGNMPYTVFEQLREDDRVRLAVPLVFGDNVGGARLIGTDASLFEIRREQGDLPAFRVAEGRIFTIIQNDQQDNAERDEDGYRNKEGLFEAVLGASAARRLNLRIGDRFLATHGLGGGIAENIHEDQYTVVGILEPTNTAYDAAVFTHYETIWYAHEHQMENLRNYLAMSEPQIFNQISAVLVLPVGFIEQNQLAQAFYTEPTLQVAFPGAEMVNLINLLNQGQQLLNVIAYLVLAIAGLTLFLSMYSAILARQQSIAIMRSIGSNRWDVFRIVIFETLIVSVAGALVGRLLGYSIALLIAAQFSQQSAIPIPVRFIWELEPILWMLSIGVGVLAGLVPAMMAYRVNVVETLFPA